MTRPRGFSEVSQAVMAEFGTIPRRALIYLAIATVVGMAHELFLWSHRPNLRPTDYALSAVLITGWIAVSYGVLMSMVQKPASVSGFAKFLAASAVIAIPLVLAVVGIIADTRLGLGMAVVGLLAILGLMLTLPLLSGWPILQSLSSRVISPLTALRATHGIRVPLICISLVSGGTSRLVPATDSTENFITAALLALGGAALGTFSAMIGFSVAVVAYRYMSDALPPDII